MSTKNLNPIEFDIKCSTVRSFPRRGNRATHNSKYRGNRSPDVVRNLILRYSKEGDCLLDPMIGGGTTAIECKLLNRNLFACDINPTAINTTKHSLEFDSGYNNLIKIRENDVRNLYFIENESVDFALTHPPYVDIIKYSDGKIEKDLSNIHDIDKFCDELEIVAKEFFRVLKEGKFCAILIGDTRRNKLYQPLAYKVMERFLKAGFKLKEDIVKVQHNCKATGFRVKKSKELNFLLIMHEHLFVFQKI